MNELKSAAEWLDSEQWHENGDKQILEQIKQIQLNAYKAGMSEAAEIVLSGGGHSLNQIKSKILSARDRKESL